MKEIILIKLGEIALKGLNRRTFEDILIKNIRRKLSPLGSFEIKSSQSTVSVTPSDENIDMDKVSEKVGEVFGIAAYSRACIAEKNMDDIINKTLDYLEEELLFAKTFKVESKRSDKKFPLKSPEISALLGEKILDKFKNLTVDVKNPDVVVTVEVRDKFAFVHAKSIEGAGGMPVGTSGNAGILISGGIDSPVAAYMMAKRGVKLTAIHFASPPYTSERAEQKVVDLLTIVSKYSGRMDMITVPFTKIQELIRDKCPEELFTVIMRRIMMKMAVKISEERDLAALITGESLGQVASQTMSAIACTDAVSPIPVFRPLIGMDKREIIDISRKIGTFETSILPYEDCCTVFTPKHPRTKPTLKYAEEAEAKAGLDQYINDALQNLKITKIY